MLRFLFPFVLMGGVALAGVTADVRVALDRGDAVGAEARLAAYRQQTGVTPEWIEAYSWLARGALATKRLDDAERYATETRRLVRDTLRSKPVDSDAHLAVALGAAIEVQAQALAAHGERAEAVSALESELKQYWETSLRTRLQKNLNLLTLVGKPAPALETGAWIGPKPATLAALKGHPVLLFFWAHWCPDCKDEAPVIERIAAAYRDRGLVVIGPTQCYGFTARGQEAPPEAELKHIDAVRQRVYGAIQDMSVPVSAENFKRYGASSVPTLVLIDGQGIVRMYYPDEMPYPELAAHIDKVLAH
jgi:thiol-disulfide isomerase/thioredoxin